MVTIIVPFKNAAPWIRRCAESLRQLDGDMEVIFVNDHSEDGSDDIVHEYEALFLQVDNQHTPGGESELQARRTLSTHFEH